MNGPLQDRVSLITGGASGMGRAAALAFAAAGSKVVLADTDPTGGEETASLIEKAGGEVEFVKTDVTISSSVEKMVRAAVDRFGRLDCAFNNAGIGGTMFVSTADYEEATFDQVVEVNLKGTFLCMKFELPAMSANGRGAIVNMSSVAGLCGGPMGAAYYASKHGVIGLTRAAAIEYAAQGLRVNAVCPGWTETPLTDPVTRDNPERESFILGMHPMGRLCTVEEVANAVVWLCSDGASYINGHALPIEGGRLIR
jgi:NAD(P)-dependent dehydrogenase (short-subunit alcohol dehydrogenase family)